MRGCHSGVGFGSVLFGGRERRKSVVGRIGAAVRVEVVVVGRNLQFSVGWPVVNLNFLWWE